jgi:hypothetical protein
MYSETVMEHFKNPRNVGTIEDADGVGEVGNPVCGDMMTFYIKVKDNRIDDIKFQTFGCGAAIAVSSMVSEMARGKTRWWRKPWRGCQSRNCIAPTWERMPCRRPSRITGSKNQAWFPRPT